MNRFIPSEKMGKKARKELDRQRRSTWSFSPATRKVESKKRYNRKTHESEEHEIVGFDCAPCMGNNLAVEVRHALGSRER